MSQVYYLSAMTDYAREEFAAKQLQFDTLVGTGLSGALVVPSLARALTRQGQPEVKWLIVRKPEDSTHSSLPVEGDLGRRWVFVDDFIASGKTFRRVKDTIASLAHARKWETQLVASYEYEHGSLKRRLT